jgi:hypothetical protein
LAHQTRLKEGSASGAIFCTGLTVAQQPNHDRTTAATLHPRLRIICILPRPLYALLKTRNNYQGLPELPKSPVPTCFIKRWRIPKLRYRSSLSNDSLLGAPNPSDQSVDMPFILDTVAQRAPQVPAPPQTTAWTHIRVTTQEVDARSYVRLLCPIALKLVADLYLKYRRELLLLSIGEPHMYRRLLRPASRHSPSTRSSRS